MGMSDFLLREKAKRRSWKDTYSKGFLKAADLSEDGRRVRITAITEETFRPGERPKLIAELKGLPQRWALNATNCELLEGITGSDDPEDWCGRIVELFNDDTVTGPNGEQGGIRVRAAKIRRPKRKRAKEYIAEDDGHECP